MHKNHGVFERGASQNRTVRLIFFGGQPRRELKSRCAPLYFSRGRIDKKESDCYYFWDFEAEEGRNFFALEPSEIVAMELTEESFSLEAIRSSRRKTEHSTSGNGPADI
jgi:hypothetical protein